MEENKSYSQHVTNIALSNDTSKFVSAFTDNTVKIWNCETDEQYLSFRGAVKNFPSGQLATTWASFPLYHYTCLGKSAQ